MSDTEELAKERAYHFFKLWVCGKKQCTQGQEKEIKTKKLGWREYADQLFNELTEKKNMKK